MKLIFENWREYLSEQEQQAPQKCVTVGSLMVQIDKMQRIETAKSAFSKFAKFIPLIGGTISKAQDIKGYFKKAKDFLSGKKINFDKIEDFPILGHLKLDPELIKVVEDDLLTQLDEMYEEEVLSKLSPNMCVSDIKSINDFIREKIAKETKNHVVIKDES